MFEFGELKIRHLEVSQFRLDGGAMFGMIPKVLWEKKCPPDALNRIPLSARILYIEGPTFKCLVDCGMGDKWNSKEKSIYEIQGPPLLEALKKHSINAEEITHLIITHLHFDHVAGATALRGDNVQAVFPNAQMLLQKENWDWAQSPHSREKASYRSENWIPYKKSGQLQLVDGSSKDWGEILPGVCSKISHGHTRGMQYLMFQAEGQAPLVYCADLIPTSSHLNPIYAMGFDVDPLRIYEERVELLDWAVENKATLIFEHDPAVSHANVEKIQGKYRLSESPRF